MAQHTGAAHSNPSSSALPATTEQVIPEEGEEGEVEHYRVQGQGLQVLPAVGSSGLPAPVVATRGQHTAATLQAQSKAKLAHMSPEPRPA